MAHGRISRIQLRYTSPHLAGVKRTRPSSTAAIAGSARRPMSQNHWSEMIGSTRAPERCEKGTVWVYGSSLRTRPIARRSSSTRAWHSAGVNPA